MLSVNLWIYSCTASFLKSFRGEKKLKRNWCLANGCHRSTVGIWEIFFQMASIFDVSGLRTYSEYSSTEIKTTLQMQNRRICRNTCAERHTHSYCVICSLPLYPLRMRGESAPVFVNKSSCIDTKADVTYVSQERNEAFKKSGSVTAHGDVIGCKALRPLIRVFIKW